MQYGGVQVHTVLIENDFDAFALSDHRGWLHAVEELRLVYQCSPHSGFIEKLIADLEQCRTGATRAAHARARAHYVGEYAVAHGWFSRRMVDVPHSRLPCAATSMHIVQQTGMGYEKAPSRAAHIYLTTQKR